MEAAAEVYAVDECIVVKYPRVFRPPDEIASRRDQRLYANSSLFHLKEMRNSVLYRG
jgi:hypothetical protein